MQKFGARGESGQTDAPRVALDRGGSTRKGWVPFHVRKELADQGENHTSILSADFVGVFASPKGNRGPSLGFPRAGTNARDPPSLRMTPFLEKMTLILGALC